MRKLILLLLLAQSSANAGVEFQYSGMFNFGGSASANNEIEIDHQGETEIEQTGNTWNGVSDSDGQTRTITTLRYRFPGTISASFPDSCYKNRDGSFAMAGWGVYQPKVTTTFTQVDGALYSSPGHPVSAGSYYKIEWAIGNAVPSGYKFTFRGQNLTGYVYVTNGPAGIYRPVGNSNQPTYVHKSGDTPNARPYLQVDYSNCGTIFRLGDPPLPSPPVVDPNETVACHFSIDGDINLGTVDSTSASGTQGSTKLYTQCNGSTSVTAKVGKVNDINSSVINQGGLTIDVYFDGSVNNASELIYSANESLTTENITAKITGASALAPGEYKESMIVTLSYE